MVCGFQLRVSPRGEGKGREGAERTCLPPWLPLAFVLGVRRGRVGRLGQEAVVCCLVSSEWPTKATEMEPGAATPA